MLTFRYELEGAGWADAYLSDGAASAEVPASYICDALRDFVDTIQSLFTSDRASCTWLGEPGEARWYFERKGSQLAIRVEWFNEVCVHPERDEYQLTLDRVLFSSQTDFLHFATQVAKELERTLAKWGPEGYLEEWHHPFPQEACRRLREKIAAVVS